MTKRSAIACDVEDFQQNQCPKVEFEQCYIVRVFVKSKFVGCIRIDHLNYYNNYGVSFFSSSEERIYPGGVYCGGHAKTFTSLKDALTYGKSAVLSALNIDGRREDD